LKFSLQGRIRDRDAVNHISRSFKPDGPKPKDFETIQAAALPVARNADGEPRVVMVTTRGSGRWTLPKGNLMPGLAPHEAARQEALEEAGLIGRIKKKSIGSYPFWKRLDGFWVLATVLVFPMKVERRIEDFKETGLRQVEEFTFFEAEENVFEPGLKAIFRYFAESKLKIRTPLAE
jgi:8-oxo-dGTP pyrophosphatase MutT (NUDIX family)